MDREEGTWGVVRLPLHDVRCALVGRAIALGGVVGGGRGGGGWRRALHATHPQLVPKPPLHVQLPAPGPADGAATHGEVRDDGYPAAIGIHRRDF
jgi:hypothetical protein